MEDESSDTATRRRFLKTAGSFTVVNALAGCSGGGSETPTESEGDDGTTATPTNATTSESGDSGTKESYTVSMAPVGEVSFEQTPKTWLANNGSWADMGVALGVEPPKGVWLTDRYHTQYYNEIPGVSVDKSGMRDLYSDGVSKEVFYNIDADVHVIDPNFLRNRFKGWESEDIEEISENVAPFFGNSIFSRGYKWHQDYQYYTLYEAFEKLSQVFQRHDRYEEFAALHDEFQQTVQSNLPPKEDRPSVAILWASGDQPKEYSPYLIDAGTSFKQWRDLKVGDALAETDVKNFHTSRQHIGFETLLEIDPDVLLLRGQEAKTATEFENTVVTFLKNHSIASELSAVTNDMVFQGGPLYQGPISNLVLTERAANQVYPDAFDGVTLFDPQRVADIVDGEF